MNRFPETNVPPTTVHRPLAKGLRALLAALLCAATGSVGAQGFPNRPVTIVVPLSTGSATDGLVRVLAQGLSAKWGQSVAVVNRPGGTGMVGASAVVNSPADGYTMISLSTSQVIATHLNDKLPVNVQREFRPVARMGSVPLVLCTRTSLGVSSVAELIALARSRPGALNYGSPGRGTTTHLAAELFARAAGISLMHVPYSAVNQAQADVAAGQLDMLFMIPGVARQLHATQRARCLLTDSPTKLALFPEIPTMKEAGLHIVDVHDWIGLAVPVATPDDIVNRISATVVEVLNDADIQKKITDLGVIPKPLPVKDFSVLFAEDFGRWGDALKTLGLSKDTR